MSAWISHLSRTEALVEFQGELQEWDDVRLHLLDETGQEIPGKIFGKVLSLTRLDDHRNQARVRFTSVSPEIYTFLRTVILRLCPGEIIKPGQRADCTAGPGPAAVFAGLHQ